MRQALAVAAVGAVAGLGLTLAGGRLVARFLTGIRPDDPVALAAAGVLLLATTSAACQLGERRVWI